VSALDAPAGSLVVSRIGRDRAVGRLRVEAGHVGPFGTIRSAVLVGLAEELVSRALDATPDGGGWSPFETRLARLAPVTSGSLDAVAVPIEAGPSARIWQTTIAAGPTVALVTHTLVPGTAPAVRRPPDVASGREPAPPPTGAVARRRQIAEAACEVIARKGFAAATIREIAAAAGLHVPTLYQYVASKDEVLELVYSWSMECLHTDVDAASAGCTTAREKLLATVRGIVRNGDRYRRQAGVMNRELRSLSDESRARVLSDYSAFLDRVAALVREGIAAGEFRPVEPVIAANMIEALCDVWPLRQFAVRRFGLDAFEAEAAAFVAASLASREGGTEPPGAEPDGGPKPGSER
jgi:AcrR family transcriptional regulator/acyl-coenzyme A thioesterase PaaI-like protein